MSEPNGTLTESRVNGNVALRISSTFGAAYDDRIHALQSQNVSHSCMLGEVPMGLPQWPPVNGVMTWPESDSMLSAEISEAANEASRVKALSVLRAVDVVRPTTREFDVDNGLLRLTVSPVTKAVDDVDIDMRLDDSVHPTARHAAHAGHAGHTSQALHSGHGGHGGHGGHAGEVGHAYKVGHAGHGTTTTANQATPMNAAEYRAKLEMSKSRAGRVKSGTSKTTRRRNQRLPTPLRDESKLIDWPMVRLHTKRLATVVPSVMYDLLHVHHITPTHGLTIWEYMLVRNDRGLYLASVLIASAVFVSAVRAALR
jgi:hypothetical protein